MFRTSTRDIRRSAARDESDERSADGDPAEEPEPPAAAAAAAAAWTTAAACCIRCMHHTFFECFPYVCPEPVLV